MPVIHVKVISYHRPKSRPPWADTHPMCRYTPDRAVCILLECILVTTHKQICEGYVFTLVCQSFCSQGGVPGQVHPEAGTPPGQVHPQDRYTPRQVHPPRTSTPPGKYTPLDRYTPGSSACWEIRATSGRYASYWNAFSCLNYFHSH